MDGKDPRPWDGFRRRTVDPKIGNGHRQMGHRLGNGIQGHHGDERDMTSERFFLGRPLAAPPSVDSLTILHHLNGVVGGEIRNHGDLKSNFGLPITHREGRQMYGIAVMTHRVVKEQSSCA